MEHSLNRRTFNHKQLTVPSVYNSAEIEDDTFETIWGGQSLAYSNMSGYCGPNPVQSSPILKY